MFDEVRDVTALLNSNVLLIAGTIIALVVIVLIALIVRKTFHKTCFVFE